MKSLKNFKEIQISQIDADERFRTDLGDIAELADNIKQNGLLHPIVVLDKSKSDDESIKTGGSPEKQFMLIAGGRRLAAYIHMQADVIPAHVFNRQLDEYELRLLELEENLKRKDFTWQEQTKLKKQIHDLYVAKFGKKTSTAPDAPGHSIKDTARILNDTTVHMDIQLAEAMLEIPSLEEAKTKDEARKKLQQIKADLAKQELARRIEQRGAKTPLEHQRKALIDKYIIGDFFEASRHVPNGVADLIEIDPPYGIDLKNVKKDDSTKLDNYNEVDAEVYEEFIQKTVSRAWELLKPNGWLIFWFAPEPWFETVYQTIKAQGFKAHRMVGIWEKAIGQTTAPNYNLGNAYEMFFYARKGDAQLAKPGKANVFMHTPVSPDKKIHPTERPIPLIQNIISTFIHGGRVIVPFAGSGNTLLACNNLGIDAIGFDLTSAYKDGYIIKVNDGTLGDFK